MGCARVLVWSEADSSVALETCPAEASKLTIY